MTISRANDRMFGLSRRQEIVARIVELLKERYPQVAAATIFASSTACATTGIPLAILLREEVAEPEAFSTEIRLQLEQATGSEYTLVLLGASGGREEAGLLRGGHLILDRDPKFRADYTWSAVSGYPASLATGGRRAALAVEPSA